MSLKKVADVIGTASGADEFRTGVEYVVARESSCHCQFSAISQFWKKKVIPNSGCVWAMNGIATSLPFLGSPCVWKSRTCPSPRFVSLQFFFYLYRFILYILGTRALRQFLPSLYQLLEGEDAHRFGYRRQRRWIKIRQWRNHKIIRNPRSGMRYFPSFTV